MIKKLKVRNQTYQLQKFLTCNFVFPNQASGNLSVSLLEGMERIATILKMGLSIFANFNRNCNSRGLTLRFRDNQFSH